MKGAKPKIRYHVYFNLHKVYKQAKQENSYSWWGGLVTGRGLKNLQRLVTSILWSGYQLLMGMASLVAQTVKHLPTVWEARVRSLGREEPLEKEMATHPVPLAGKSHGRRSLVGYSPWGLEESDTTEWLHFTTRGCSVCKSSPSHTLRICALSLRISPLVRKL